MRYSDDFVEKVREANDIKDVVGSYVRLQNKGSVFMGLCPFHSEKTPSFAVTPSRGTYHCFGCGASGDVYSFLMEYENVTFPEAVVMLAERAGIPITQEDLSEEQQREQKLRNNLLELQKEAATYYIHKLYSPAGRNAMAYLKRRGLSDKTIRAFGLGYADKTGGLYGHLKEKGYTDALIKKSGLFSWDEKKSLFSDKFWNRVMFPIMDVNRRVIGFGGRVMGDAKPKYLNSPETELFEKSKNLYGLYAAKQKSRGKIVVCEGYMDVISLHQAGFENAVASLGTALTRQHAVLIRRYAKEVLLLYDSDEAGVRAALRAVPLLRQAGLKPKIVDLAPYKDPDELLNEAGAEEMKKRFDSAENGFMFEIRKAYESYEMSDPQAVSDFQHETVKKIYASFSDEIERNSYIQSVSQKYGIDADTQKRELRRLAMRGEKQEDAPMEEIKRRKAEKKKPRADAERTLLSWLCKLPSLIPEAKSYVSPEDFTDGVERALAEQLMKAASAGSPAALLNRFEESGERSEAAAIIEWDEPPQNKEDASKALKEIARKIKADSLERKRSEVTPDDMAALQAMIDEKKKLEQLGRH